MFKNFVFFMAVVLMAILSTVVTAQDSENEREVSLTPEQSMRILDFQAAGKIAEADSLKRVFLNQIFLDKAAADSIQSKLDAERTERKQIVLTLIMSIVAIGAILLVLVSISGRNKPNRV